MVGADRDLTDRVEEAETRVEKVERWVTEMTEALSSCIKQQKAMQHKLNDLKSCSRCNNIRLYHSTEKARKEFKRSGITVED